VLASGLGVAGVGCSASLITEDVGRDAAPAIGEPPLPALADASVALGPPPLCEVVVDCGGQPIVDEPKVHCTLAIGDGRGTNVYEGRAGVELRGRTSLYAPKKQYAVELEDVVGQKASVDLFGMGRESDWILNGAYIDRSLIRNKLFYDLFQELGGPERYAAESRHCELTLDGEWRGIYLLGERIKRDGDRVAIAADDAGSGASFILKVDDHEGTLPNPIGHGAWQLVYPHRDRATPAQVAGITAWLDGWADAVTGADPDADLFALVDLDSAVDFVLLEELARNVDAYHLSVHIWKDVGGRLHFLPWDLDLTIGQPDANGNAPSEGWVVRRPPLIQAMADDPRFQRRLVERWSELRATRFTVAGLDARIATLLTTIGPRLEDNFSLWPIDQITFGSIYPVTSHAEEIDHLKTWLAARLVWIDAEIGSFAAGTPADD
jgi:hypothetical protein